ncbi:MULTISPECIES: NnrS family protein [Xanthomonas]|uniref:NnrS family protein n=1 Tax=Xanthomonas TaxID=338 RepID=UPI001786E34D|nr:MULTISPECIES: NnrS family protein [Xanthomonas]MDR6672171.1 uncharacterized protein involved in response to NO [Xanthomonas translucens]MEB1527591.1 NnrS family protein [Xanthomonas campestris pv. campestris]MBD7922172.1 NnrS family protein [Xanthomonas surreyensis]MBN6110187.1 NnrS family protein [Xanthomonas bonasiae]MDL5365372.1 NnrS family protein [Xanthomonas sp. NCPPB 2654]
MPNLPASHEHPSPAMLARAPHRLLFFVGAGNLLLLMAWWALWLAGLHGGWALPQPPLPAGWLHALAMQYLVLPSFVFGFLLTVFPRWMGLPELPRRHYVPIGAGLFGGQAALLLAMLGWAPGLWLGLALAIAGWSGALVVLGGLLKAERGRTWHAYSCYAALLLGWLGLLAFAGVAAGESRLMAANIALGSFGLLLPLYLSVAHRMFPFFAGNAVPGYVAWRPLWWLAAMWATLLAHLALALAGADAWLWLADAPALALAAYALWRWWPRGCMPGLLAALFIGMAWLPVTYALYVVQSVGCLLTGQLLLGRGPIHALSIGLFGSLLVAMVTRVTQGHSGRPLTMPPVAWFAFAAIQGVATMRVVAELTPDPLRWQVAAAVGWLLALAPWVARIGRIYLSPRPDGKGG